MKKLYPQQEVHAARLEAGLAQHRGALDSSKTGCGKTVVNSEIARRLNRPTFVVCPKSVIPSWERELASRGVAATVINYEKLRTGKTGLGAMVNRQWKFTLPADALIIWDECHKCMSIKSINGKMLAAAKPFLNLMLSATAAEDPTEMRSLGYVLGLHNLVDFWNWAKRNGCKPGVFGGLEFKGGEAALVKVREAIFGAGRGSMLTVEDLSDHFTETQINTEPLDFGDEGAIDKLYEEMEAEVAQLRDVMAGDDTNPAAQALVAQLRARQQVELLKVPLIAEMARDLTQEGRSVVIFVNFKATIQALRERLGLETPVIEGGQTAQLREECIKRFQSNEVNILLANTSAGGTGINLHDEVGGHPRTALISPSFNAKEIIQVTGRIHRAGGKSATQQRILFAAGTVEEKVEKAVREKIRNILILNSPDLTVVENPSTLNIQEMIKKETAPSEPAPTPAKEVDHASREHAKFSPSSLAYRELCPGWENDNSPDRDTSAAELGTRIHEAIELENLSKLDGEDYLVAEMCLNYVAGLSDEKTQVFKEVRLKVLDQYGTVDWVGVNGGTRADLVDYKTGRLAVPDAEVNVQMQAYMLGLWDKFKNVDEVNVHILLPRRDEVSTHTFNRDSDYTRVKWRIETIITRAKLKDPSTFSASPTNCKYCGNKGKCSALAEKALNLVEQIQFVRGEGEEIPSMISEQDPDNISKLLTIAPILEDWAKKVREEALRLHLYEGVEIPGYRLTERSTPRGVTSPLAAWDVLKERMTFEDFMSSVSRVSITELENNFSAKAARGQKSKAKQELENILRDAGIMKDEGVVQYLKPVK